MDKNPFPSIQNTSFCFGNTFGDKKVNIKKHLGEDLTVSEQENKFYTSQEYVVESINGYMEFNSQHYYLVKWKGYESLDDITWEPESEIIKCKKHVLDFWKKNRIKFYQKPTKRRKETKPIVGKTFLSNKSTGTIKRIKTTNDKTQEIVFNHLEYFQHPNNEPRIVSTIDSEDSSNKINIENCCNKITESKDIDNDETIKVGSRTEGNNNDFINDSDYVMKKIIDSRIVNNQKYYLVKWKGYPKEESTWMLENTIKDKEIIYKYEEKMPQKDEIRVIDILMSNENMEGESIVSTYNVKLSNGSYAWIPRTSIPDDVYERYINEKTKK
ncbi:hypothetical protein TRFO_30374 [Tritrichomonas foetus]|uniref:Chromo domain-containing protein n=1 Tax=Tritrichomonas foetus TaxID=1144522 RepID=A0A1J4JTP3_9EUKA|nr:hypothetical protein TRFO_30374 [Tritrichomonas foetus]|eukprot:OHT02489.1 hypothetical protein TRFO_30374 [Tritrichomonas foetus]